MTEGLDGGKSAKGKKFRLLVVFTGLALLFLIALGLLIPRIIDTQAVRVRVEEIVSRETAGAISFGRLSVHVFPRPRVVLSDINVSFQDRVGGSISSVEVFPRVISLLRGNLVIESVRANKPTLTVTLPVRDEKKEGSALSLFQKTVGDLSGKARGLYLSVRGGKIRLVLEGGNVDLSNLKADVAVGPERISIDLESETSFAQKVSIHGSLVVTGFGGSGEVLLKGIRLNRLPPSVRPSFLSPVVEAEGDLRLHYRAAGLSDLRLYAEAALPKLTLQRGKTRTALNIKAVHGSISVKGETTRITVEKVDLEQPVLTVSGEVVIDGKDGKIAVDLKGKDLDLQSIRSEALAFAGDIPLVRDIFKYLEGGKVSRISAHSKGGTWETLVEARNLRITGEIEDGLVYIPGPDIRFTGVSGDARIEQGVLMAARVTSSLGAISGSKGTVRVGLRGSDAPLHVEADVKADAAQVPALLRRLVKADGFRAEVNRIRDVSGSVVGRVIIGERLDDIHVAVDASDITLRAQYDRLPSVLALDGGKFSYRGDLVGVEDLRGRMGGTSFTGLRGEVRLGQNPQIEIRSGSGSIHLDEVYPWISSLVGPEALSPTVKNLQGRLEVSTLSVHGPLRKPGDWDFSIAGVPKNFVITAKELPGPLALTGGAFQATGKQLKISGTKTRLLDSTLNFTCSLEGYLKELSKVEITGQGDIGPGFVEWGAALLKIDDWYRPRAPFTASNAAVTWERGNPTVFQASLKMPGGPSVDLRGKVSPNTVSIESAHICDTWSDASLSLHLDEKEISVGFTGKLVQKTADAILRGLESRAARVEGDFRARIDRDQPFRSSAQGSLSGERLSLPVAVWGVKEVGSFSILGRDKGITVANADFTMGKASLKANGDVTFLDQGIGLNLNVSAERIAWDEIAETAAKAARDVSRSPDKNERDLQVQGIVRLRTDVFDLRGFPITPLHADISLRPGVTGAKIQRASVCGIETTGDLNLTQGLITLDAGFRARDQELRPTILCLTHSRSDATGTFSVRASVKAKGRAEELRKSIKGQIALTSMNGSVYRSKPLGSVFDFLNKGEEIPGEMPDLNKKEFSYKRLEAKATYGGGLLTIDEGFLNSEMLHAIGQGTIQIEDGSLDLDVMVAPLKTVSRITRNVPLIGTITGGSLVSVPVKVRGTFTDPKVTYLAPSVAVSNLAEMMKRSIGLPFRIFSPLFPREQEP